MKVKVTQSCLTLWDPNNYRVQGILQARILAWVAFPFSRGSPQPRDRTQVSNIADRSFYQLSHKRSPRILEWIAYPLSRRSSLSRNWIQFSLYLNVEFQRTARRDKKAFLSNQCKEIEENNRMGKTRDPSRKLEIPREHFMQRWAQ